jgi:hypothetical protein
VKPRIWKVPGSPWWMCGLVRSLEARGIGMGATPAQAYSDWELSNRLWANLNRPFGHGTDTRNGVLPL